MKKLFTSAFILCLLLNGTSFAMPTIIVDENSLIDFKPFDELFAFEYQPKYIIDGWIDVGSYSFNVFADYSMQERQQIYQICEKYLPWEYTLLQEQWERTMYMYQFVVKPHPFPYSQFKVIPVPNAIVLVLIGLVTLLLRRKDV